MLYFFIKHAVPHTVQVSHIGVGFHKRFYGDPYGGGDPNVALEYHSCLRVGLCCKHIKQVSFHTTCCMISPSMSGSWLLGVRNDVVKEDVLVPMITMFSVEFIGVLILGGCAFTL